jgi:hypothetical protein
MMEEQEPQQLTSTDKPQIIYHYTNQEGLFGILKDKKIWATHVRYLNDLQEVKAGEEAFKLVKQDVLESKGEILDNAIESKIKQALEIIRNCDIYVASFSAANCGDSLSLWRAYSTGGVGISLGFSLPRLRSAIEMLIPANVISQGGRWLSKVSYLDTKTQPSSWPVDSVVFKMAFKIMIDSLTNPVADSNTIKLAAWGFARFFPTIKDSGFKDEEEYRILEVRSQNNEPTKISEVKYRRGSFSIIPYLPIQLPLRSDEKQSIELSRVVVGPSSHREEAVRAVKMLLRDNGLHIKSEDYPDGVEVVPSQIPYRNW